MNSLIIIMILLSLILAGLGVIIIIIANKKEETIIDNTSNNIEKVKILLSDDKIIDKINNILTTMISDASDRYMVLNVNFNSEAYLPPESIDELSKYIFGTVRGNITPATRELLGLVYDVSTDEKLDQLIDINIKMHILHIVVKTNQSITE